MSRKISLTAVLMLIAFLLGGVRARAAYNVSVLFTPLFTQAHPGDILTYDVTFTNFESFDITLDTIGLNLDNPPSGFDPNWITPVLNTSPFTIAAGSSGGETTHFSGLFSVVLDSALETDPSYLTTYSGQMSFYDQTSGAEVLRDYSVTVSSAPIPEPPFIQMSVLLALGGVGWKWRRKRHL